MDARIRNIKNKLVNNFKILKTTKILRIKQLKVVFSI